MARFDLNEFQLCGHLTRDPELSYTPNNVAVCKFSIASNRGEEVSYFDVVCWGKVAEAISQYAKKGKQVICTGNMKQERWLDKDTQKNRSKVVMNARGVQLMGGPREDGETTNGSAPGARPAGRNTEVPHPGRTNPAPQAQAAGNRAPTTSQGEPIEFDGMEDDELPF